MPKGNVVFEEVEAAREVGDYVVPVLARSTEQQERHFTTEQNDVYVRIRERQYVKAIAVDFVNLSEGERIGLIDKIADDIVGMIERLRTLPPSPARAYRRPVRPRYRKEFDSTAQNYQRVDFLTDGEVVLDRSTKDGQRTVLAHVGFIERLYVQGEKGRIEFGVRRAFLSIKNEGPGQLLKIDELRGGDDHKTRYYATLQDAPDAIAVCIDPAEGKTSLAELPLPPAQGENLLSKVATATTGVMPEGIKAELLVSLDAEGLYLADGGSISPRAQTL